MGFRGSLVGPSLLAAVAACRGAGPEPVPLPVGEWNPQTYVCQRAPEPLTIDGRLDEAAWQSAAWTEEFRDIQGPPLPTPRFSTRARMLWDDQYFYMAAVLEEPDVWANLTERDSIIFYDNDFEVFLDPDGDTHEYYELEVNALATEWDLFLAKPYRDGGPADHDWNMPGLQTGVTVQGTLNQPGDVDQGWTVEIAIPWAALDQDARQGAPPVAGDQWWVDFSRVEWRVHVEAGAYVKDVDPATGKPYPEDNWVWSPTGLINMHYPERWGLVEFSSTVSGLPAPAFRPRADADARALLWQVYYLQRTHRAQVGHFTDDVTLFGPIFPDLPLSLTSTGDTFAAETTTQDGQRLAINEVGRLTVVSDVPD